MNQVGTTKTGSKNRGLTIALALSMLLASLGTSIANIALPALAEVFSAPIYHVQWVVVAYLAALTISVVIAGWLGDLYGLRRMHLLGLGLFSLASLLCGLAPNLWLLVGARALQGIGAAFLMTLTMALMRETADEARLGRSMGLLGTISALGTALGPSVGGMLLPLSGWRGIFLVQTPLAVLALVLAVACLPRDMSKERASAVGLRSVLEPGLAPNLLVNLLVATVMMATLVVGPFYLSLGLGLKEGLMGLVMSVGPMISIVSGIPSGRAVDIWGPRRILGLGLILLAGGAFLLAVLPDRFGTIGYLLAIVVLTPGYQLFQAANNTDALTDVAKDRRGAVSGMLSLSRNIGLILGASAMSSIFAAGVGVSDLERASPMEVDAGLRLTFMLAGGLMVLALLIAAIGIRRSNQN